MELQDAELKIREFISDNFINTSRIVGNFCTFFCQNIQWDLYLEPSCQDGSKEGSHCIFFGRKGKEIRKDHLQNHEISILSPAVRQVISLERHLVCSV